MNTPENHEAKASATGRIAERAAARKAASSSPLNSASDAATGVAIGATTNGTAADGTENRAVEPKSRKNKGLGAIIVAVYAIFALSSAARAGYQILTKFEEAPLAYVLSALAAVVYIVATIALGSSSVRSWLISRYAVLVELVGVILVGALSYLIPEHFSHPAVWSHFGQGYGYIPLILPLIGLWWLRRTKPASLRGE